MLEGNAEHSKKKA